MVTRVLISGPKASRVLSLCGEGTQCVPLIGRDITEFGSSLSFAGSEVTCYGSFGSESGFGLREVGVVFHDLIILTLKSVFKGLIDLEPTFNGPLI